MSQNCTLNIQVVSPNDVVQDTEYKQVFHTIMSKRAGMIRFLSTTEHRLFLEPKIWQPDQKHMDGTFYKIGEYLVRISAFNEKKPAKMTKETGVLTRLTSDIPNLSDLEKCIIELVYSKEVSNILHQVAFGTAISLGTGAYLAKHLVKKLNQSKKEEEIGHYTKQTKKKKTKI